MKMSTVTLPESSRFPQSSTTVTSIAVGHPTAALKPVPNKVKTGRSWVGVQPVARGRVGPHAGEIMVVVQTAMMGKLPYTALRDAVFTHPTMAEGLGPLFGGVPARTPAGASTVSFA
jgi:hypothetical protein